MDFILLRLIKILGLDPDQGLFFVYDIVCQYIINIQKWIGKDLPEGLTIEQAINLFHVHCHKNDCFFCYATTFIPSAAVVTAQILKLLWSTLNTISPKLCTTSLPHHAETLDDHACDSSNKKMLSMTDTLMAKYLDSKDMILQASKNYTKIIHTVEPVILRIWEEEIQLAEKNKLKNINAMDVYLAQIPSTSVPMGVGLGMGVGVGVGEELVLTPQDEWMEFALVVEESQ